MQKKEAFRLKRTVEEMRQRCYNDAATLHNTEKEKNMGFPEKIKDIRRQSLLSQTDFAKELGVSYSTVNRWETGKTLPTYKAMKSIEAFCSRRNIEIEPCIELWKGEK